MNRTLALSLCIACGAAGTAFADDITVDPTPFVSTATRAQVREELRQFQKSGVNPWADDYSQMAQFHGTKTRAEVTADYMASRDMVSAMGSEDSGSAYLTRSAAAAARPATTNLAHAE